VFNFQVIPYTLEHVRTTVILSRTFGDRF
jgi:hypothetical protein